MATINHADGTQTYLGEPTTTDRQKREIKEAQLKNDKRVEAMEKDQREKERARVAALPTQGERFELMLRGATRLAARLRRQGATVKADKLQGVADQMADALETFRKAKKAEAAPVATPLADAVAVAAAELRKKLPGCFPTEGDAEEFAGRHLPLTDARAAQVHVTDARAKAGRAALAAAVAFWTFAETAANIATGSAFTTAISDLENAGSL